MVKYLARYMTGGPISNSRLIEVKDDRVYFLACSKDKTGSRERVSHSGVEFLRHWCLHILPKGFTKVRCYGGWSWLCEQTFRLMPRISHFYGISVYMYYGDHAPPHLHAIYGDAEATFRIEDGSPLAGGLPRRAAKLVREWTAVHQVELLENWQRAGVGEPLLPVEPLD